jgi:protein-tyrosine kinase
MSRVFDALQNIGPRPAPSNIHAPEVTKATLAQVPREFPELGDIRPLRHATPPNSRVLGFDQKQHDIRERFRFLAHRLRSVRRSHPVTTVLLTSVAPKEGKTLTCVNLATTLASSSTRVLLIDADMRKPRIHTVFSKENKVGLSNYLSGQVELDAAIQKTEIESICLITAGGSVPNPSELLGSNRFRELVLSVKNRFDIIIIDSPPIAAVTDSLIIGNSVDGMILIVENGKTPKRALPHIAQILEKSRIRVIGAIMNKISITQNNYYYYSRYYGK